MLFLIVIIYCLEIYSWVLRVEGLSITCESLVLLLIIIMIY